MREERASTQTASGSCWSDAQRSAVREEMNRILSHPTFSTSNRCIALLRFIVKQVKLGEESDLKERTLGIEVFGREADYDVGTDPIVRRVASEVRKRLAQYYQEEPNGHSVKIHLLRGSYIPEFEFLTEAHRKLSAEQAWSLSTVVQAEKSSAQLRIFHRSRWWALVVAGFLLATAAGSLLWRSGRLRSPIERVWKPLLDSDGAIIVCLADDSRPDGKFPANAQRPSSDLPAKALFHDLRVGNSITSLLSRLNKRSELRPTSVLKYSDFQQNTIVLIGMNNPWLRMILANQRYRVHFDPMTRDRWVQDMQNPSKRDWKIDGVQGVQGDLDPLPQADYAVITRIFNEETGQWILALSGLEGYATQAAGELVTNPEMARKIPLRISTKGNFQIVLRTSLVGTEPGPIEIVAVHTW